MIEIVFLQGGLGNQMFQYAFYLSKRHSNMKIRCDYSLLQGQNRSHNGFELDDVFGIVDCKSNILNRWVVRALIKINHLDKKWKCYLFFIFRLLKVRYVEDEIPSKYDRLRLIPDAKGGCCYFLGYWQSEKYFKGIEREIRAIFRFKEDEISECSRSILYQIKKTQSVSVHVRREDYLNVQNQKLYGGICTLQYYYKAISYFTTLYGQEIFFFIFSNDAEWVKCNFDIPNMIIVDCNQGENAWQDMFLMSKCTHNIIANSSFSWWGAWLNTNDNKRVISPSRFMNIGDSSDIIPSDWIVL